MLRFAFFLSIVAAGQIDSSCCVSRGVGGCRLNGASIQNYVRKYPTEASIANCVQMCADDACCKGVEATGFEGCEIYTDVTPASSSGSGSSECYDCSACERPEVSAVGGVYTVTDECQLQKAISAVGATEFIEVDGELVVWSARTISSGTVNIRGKDVNATIKGHVGRDADTNAVDSGNRCFEITGGDVTFSNLTVTECAAYGAGATGNGGAIHLVGSATVRLEFCMLSNNHAYGQNSQGGGGIFVSDGGSVTIIDSTIKDCTSNLDGGGVYIEDDGSTIAVTTSLIQQCNALNGGGLYNKGGAVTIETSSIDSNSVTTGNGGGIYHSTGGTLNLQDVAFTANNANQGKDLYVLAVYECSYSACASGDPFSTNTVQCFGCDSAACEASAVCSVDCEMGWSEWGACQLVDGQGKRSRTAVVVTPASGAGVCTGKGEEQTEDCVFGEDCVGLWELTGNGDGCQCRGDDTTKMPTEEYRFSVERPAVGSGAQCEFEDGELSFRDCGSPFECNGEFTEGDCVEDKFTRTWKLNAPYCGPNVQCWPNGYTDEQDCEVPPTTVAPTPGTAPTSGEGGDDGNAISDAFSATRFSSFPSSAVFLCLFSFSLYI